MRERLPKPHAETAAESGARKRTKLADRTLTCPHPGFQDRPGTICRHPPLDQTACYAGPRSVRGIWGPAWALPVSPGQAPRFSDSSSEERLPLLRCRLRVNKWASERK